MDTIDLILRKEFAPSTSFLEEIPVHLTDWFNEGRSIYQFGRETIKGKLGNLKISITEDEIRINDGSLQKWYFGNNIGPFERKEIKKAFEKLGDLLHIPINNAEIKKFHFGKNIIVDQEPGLYLPYLGICNRFKRCEQPNGINYKSINRGFAIYDKIKEVKNRRESIPPTYKNCNIIRLESQYNRNINKYFNTNLITPETITNKEFYNKIKLDWFNTYSNIDKLKKNNFDMKHITTKKDYEKLGVLALIDRQGGKIAALQNIDEKYKKGELTRKQTFDLRQLVKQCSNQKIFTIESELITELNRVVKESFMAE